MRGVIVVHRDQDGNLVIENRASGTRLVLKPYQGVYVMKRLAEELGFRVSLSKPLVRFKLEALSVRVWLTEGRVTRSFVVPFDVLLAYVSVLREAGGRVSKRELAERVACRLSGGHRELGEFFRGGVFDWEKFIGSRSEYYVYFHVPVLVLEALGLVKVTSRHVQPSGSIAQVDAEALKSRLAAGDQRRGRVADAGRV